MPGLLRGVARTAAIAGTATAVSGRVQRRQAEKFADRDAGIAATRGAGYEQGAQSVAYQQAPQAYQQVPQGYQQAPQGYQQTAPTYQQAQPVAPAAPAAPAAPPVDFVSQLKELAELKNQGILTEEEFATQKARLLA